jgi:hypothetical protein
VRTTLTAATGTNTQTPIDNSNSGFPILAVGVVAAIFVAIACCLVGIYMFVIRKNSPKEALHLYELMDKQSGLMVSTGNRDFKPSYNFRNDGSNTPIQVDGYRFGSNLEVEPEPIYHDPYVNGGGYVIPQVTSGYIDTYHVEQIDDRYAAAQKGHYFEPHQGYYGDDKHYYEEEIPHHSPVQNQQQGYYDDNYYNQDLDHQHDPYQEHGQYYDEEYDSYENENDQDYHDARRDTIISTDSEAHHQFENVKNNVDPIVSTNSSVFNDVNNRDSIVSTDSNLSVYKDYKNAYSSLTNGTPVKPSPLRNAYRDSISSDDSYIYAKKNLRK